MTTAVAIIALAMGAPGPAGGDVYRSRGGGFEVAMGRPTREGTATLRTPDGPIVVHTVEWDGGRPSTRDTIEYADYPTILHADIDAFLDAAVADFAFVAGGVVSTTKRIERDGSPGRFVFLDNVRRENETLEYRADLFMVGRRLFRVSTRHPKFDDPPGDADREGERFRESFRVVDESLARKKPGASTPRAASRPSAPKPGARPKKAAGKAARRREAWSEFTSEEGRFSVTWPGVPEPATKDLAPLAVRMLTVATDRGAFNVSYMDYPEDAAEPDPARIFAGVQAGIVKNIEGEPISRIAIELDGHPGLELTLRTSSSTIPGGGLYKARIYLVGRRNYQVVAMLPHSRTSDADADRFLDSFALTGPPPAADRAPANPAPGSTKEAGRH